MSEKLAQELDSLANHAYSGRSRTPIPDEAGHPNGWDGIELLEHLTREKPDSKVIIVTAHGSIGMAMTAMLEQGAFYVHSKLEEGFLTRLGVSVKNAFKEMDLGSQIRRLQERSSSPGRSTGTDPGRTSRSSRSTAPASRRRTAPATGATPGTSSSGRDGPPSGGRTRHDQGQTTATGAERSDTLVTASRASPETMNQ